MMTPFKFGKKKNKEETFSSPSSKQSSKSPQTSAVSTATNGDKGKDVSVSQYHAPTGSTPVSHRQGSQGSLNRSPQYSQAQGQAQQYNQYNAHQPTQYAPQHQAVQKQIQPTADNAVGYDQNNNLCNQKSPQRQHQQTPHQQYSYSPQHRNNGASPPPRFQNMQNVQPQQISKPPMATPWTRSKLLISPFPRYRHAASQFANDKGEIFVMGGLHNTSVYGDTWIIKPEADGKTFQTSQVDIYDNSPAPRVGHAATTCGNAFVVFGGDTVTNDDGEIDNDLYLFNMNSHTWTIPHPLGRKPSGRYGHSIGVIAITNFDSKIYMYGGQLDDTVYNDLCVFNLSSFRRPDVSWEWVTPADTIRPPPLTNHTMDVYDNKLWIFGGSNGKSLTNDLWSYDPMTNKWDKHKTFGDVPASCEEHASVVYKDCLIVSGGKDSYGEAIEELSFLNLITKTWFKLPQNLIGTPKGKYGHSISVLKGDKLLILGGHLPDYAHMGENLEPSMDDNGVGTLLNTLDLSNLEKLITGFQQYRTPGNVRDQERFQGPQSIFTPPQAQQQSPQKDVVTSPEPYISSSNGTAVGSSSNATLQAAGAAAGAVAAGTAAATTVGATSYSSLDKTNAADRVTSAEDVFQRERQVEVLERQTPQKIPQRQQSLQSQRTPSLARGRPEEQDIYPSAEEEDLPLQLPSPVRSAVKTTIPDPLPKDDESRSKQAGVHSLPGAFESVQQGNEENFQTPSSSPNKEITAVLAEASGPAPPYLGNQKRDSDFLDSYVNGRSTPELVDPTQEKLHDMNISQSTDFGNDFSQAQNTVKSEVTEAPSTSALGKGTTVLGAGAAAVGAAAVGIVGIGSSKASTSPALQGNEIQSPVGSTGVARSVSVARNVNSNTGVSNAEKAEFQSIITSLSKELENLKTTTNEQMKSASSKVQSLEAENQALKQQVADNAKELPEPEDLADVKRKHIKLSTDYQLLTQEHQNVKSKHLELQDVFSSNLFDLQKLNNVIKEQSRNLEQQQKELDESKTLKQQFEELQFKYESLSKEHEASKELGSKSFLESQEEVKKLNTGLDSFLAQYLVTDDNTGEVKARSLGSSTYTENEGVTTQLRSQIDELLKENEEVHTHKKDLESQLKAMQTTTSEVEALRAKVAELSKLEENYKESLHSVNTANRALQLSQSELVKEKELSLKLKHEIDELKLFRAKKGSRNATPIITQQDSNNMVTDEDDDEDVANAHYNLKIRDLQAELYIIKKERDDLKDEALGLKKKLYNAENPSGSF